MRLPPSPTRARAGATLVELMLACMVLTIAVLSAMQAQTTALRLAADAHEREVAAMDLDAALEAILVTAQADIPTEYPAGEALAWFDELHLTDEAVVIEYPDYDGIGAIPDPLTIVATIRWTGRDARARQLSSMVAKLK